MRNLRSNHAISLYVEFLDTTGATVTPDDSSVSYSLYGAGGAELLTDQSLSVTSTQATITIPATENVVSSGSAPRELVVSYTVDSVPYERSQSYRVIASKPYNTTVDDARRLIGLDAKELPDSALDFYEAYEDVSDDCSTLDTLLSSGSTRANKAIALKALINLGASYYARMMLSVSSNTKTAMRTNYADPAALLAALESDYDDVLAVLNEDTLDSIEQLTRILVTSPSVDVVTNDDPATPGED